MISYADAAALKVKEAWTCIEVAITQPSALTLYLSDSPFTYGGNFYQPVLTSIGSVCSKNNGGVGAISTFTFTMANRRLQPQANATDVAADLFDDYRLLGAAATLKQFYKHPNGTVYGDTLFSGIISEVHDIALDSITFEVDESASADVIVPRYTIEGDTFANAPEESIGARVPMLFGSFLSDATVASASDTLRAYVASLGFATPISQCVMYNDKAGTSPAFWSRYFLTEYVAADHDLNVVPDQAIFQYFPEANVLCSHTGDADELVVGTTINELGGHYVSLHARRRLVCRYLLTDTTGAGAFASDAITDLEHIADRDIDNYASIDNGEQILFALPEMPPLGAIYEGDSAPPDFGIALCILVGTGGTGNVKVMMTWDGSTAKWGSASTFAANPANPTVGRHILTHSGGWDGTSWEEWQFWENSVLPAWFRVYKDDVTTARIHAAWLEVTFYPSYPAKRDKSPARTTTAWIRPGQSGSLPTRVESPGGAAVNQWTRGPGRNVVKSLAQFCDTANAYNSSLYFGGESYEDDGAGTYTGSAGALIQNPSDIIRFLCLEVCGLSSGLINSTASTLGSFPDARADLNLLTNAVTGSATYKLSTQ